MAEAFFQVLIENVTSLIKSQVGLIMGVDNEMKKLANTLTTIQKVLEDAEDRQFHDRSIQFWLSQLNGMAFEIEDILDDCNTKLSKLKQLEGTNFLNKLLKGFSEKHKVGRRIKEAAQKLEALAKDRHNYHLTESKARQPNERDWRRATGSLLIDPDHVYGRDEDRDMIVEMLVNDERVTTLRLSVLPIYGLGGIGKTTLAQFIFNDERVTKHFDTQIWVCVSDHYNLIDILKAIIESVSGNKPNLDNLDSLQRCLRKELNEKRYLLILDDVWNDNQEDWDILKGAVECGSMGSSIVVTARMQKVADIMGTLPSNCLKQLSEEHCWLLFKRRAFGQENQQCYGNLEAIGRRIVKKCGGVPLAAKTLGGLLSFRKDEKEWIHVEESHLWDLPQKKNSILPVLRLSYHYLPFVLKRCFVYCALFPKDHVFEKTELIFHWMAHGCITSNGKREVEDVGDQIWNELTWRSFFQEVRTTSEGETTFKMHDLVHDLAQSMENEITGAEPESSNTSVPNNKIREVHCEQFGSKYISSRISVEVEVSKLSSIMNYSRLRILKLNRIDGELPSAIGKLKQLRFFKLSNSSISTLPRTFYRLGNLQIFILKDCCELKSLPQHMRYMNNLRHILLGRNLYLSEMPYRIRELTSLKTLSLFIVGDTQVDELEHLNLGGKLEIKHLERVKNHLIAKKANLNEKSNLRDLVLYWGDKGLYWERDTSSELTGMELDEEVLEALEPHPNLVTLNIHGFRGRKLALWMKSMKQLRCFKLTHSPHIITLPHTFCDLRNLQILILKGCFELKSLPKDMRCMTNMRHILLEKCSSLSDMPYRIGELTSLKTLSLYIVGDKTGNQVDELEHLNLGGKLEIKHLERVKNHLIAKKANLVEKPNLHDLSFRWDVYYYNTLRLTEMELDEEVLEALEPHPNLVTLTIYGFRGRGLAFWMKSMKNITRMTLWTSFNIKHVSVLGDLPLLKSLSLHTLKALEYIVVEETGFGREMAKFPSLEKLSLSRLPNVKGLLKEGEVVEMFPNLQSLDITNCGSLRLTSSSGGPNFRLRKLTALQELIILGELELIDDVAEEMKHLHLLKHLRLVCIDEMVSLPEALQHIPSLQSLTLLKLPQLTSLPDWLPNLASLTELQIEDCPELPSLPSSIQGMTNLKFLGILYCLQLNSRCQEPNGEDWHNISHIPRLEIW